MSKENALQLMTKYKSNIAQALPSHVKIDKLIRVISSQISQNPELGLCDPISMMSAVMRCAQLGLEPGAALSKIHLIPYNNRKANKKEVNVIVGYQGLVELARRSGEILELYAEAVYQADFYKVTQGLYRNIEHVPAEGDRGELKAVYAVAKYKSGGNHFVSMSKAELEEIRTRPKYPNPIWQQHYSEMAKKTAIRRLSKLLPLSAELAEATKLQAAVEVGDPQRNETLLIEAGVDVPRDQNEFQRAATEKITNKVSALLEGKTEERITEVTGQTRDEFMGNIIDEDSALTALEFASKC